MYLTVCMYVCMYVRTYVRTYVRMYVRTYMRTYIHMYVHMYVCMYACMYVCMYVCIYYEYVRECLLSHQLYICYMREPIDPRCRASPFIQGTEPARSSNFIQLHQCSSCHDQCSVALSLTQLRSPTYYLTEQPTN